MRCVVCHQVATDFWEFIEAIVCEACVRSNPDLLHNYTLHLYDENENRLDEVVSANMIIDVRRYK